MTLRVITHTRATAIRATGGGVDGIDSGADGGGWRIVVWGEGEGGGGIAQAGYYDWLVVTDRSSVRSHDVRLDDDDEGEGGGGGGGGQEECWVLHSTKEGARRMLEETEGQGAGGDTTDNGGRFRESDAAFPPRVVRHRGSDDGGRSEQSSASDGGAFRRPSMGRGVSHAQRRRPGECRPAADGLPSRCEKTSCRVRGLLRSAPRHRGGRLLERQGRRRTVDETGEFLRHIWVADVELYYKYIIIDKYAQQTSFFSCHAHQQ